MKLIHFCKSLDLYHASKIKNYFFKIQAFGKSPSKKESGTDYLIIPKGGRSAR